MLIKFTTDKTMLAAALFANQRDCVLKIAITP